MKKYKSKAKKGSKVETCGHVVPVEMTKASESQKVTVKGTGKAKKQSATWY